MGGATRPTSSGSNFLAFRRPNAAHRYWLRAFRDVAINCFALRFADHDIRERTPRLNALVNQTRPSGRSPATRIEIFMGNILQDFRFAARMIRRSPGFSAAVVLTLTLGIGANAAIFSVLDGVVLSPLPYPDADRLVHVWTQYPQQDIDRFEVSQLEFNDYRLESELFEAMFAPTAPAGAHLRSGWSPLVSAPLGHFEPAIAANAAPGRRK